MKKAGILVLFFLVAQMHAQDTLVLRDGSKLVSLVLLVNGVDIRYKPISNITGPDLYMPTHEVERILYKNGNVIKTDSAFALNIKLNAINRVNPDSVDMYQRGKDDANQHYTDNRAGKAMFGIAIAGGALAYIPAVICGIIPPAEKNLHYPDEQLWTNARYRSGYVAQAKKLKWQRTVGPVLTAGIATTLLYTALITIK